MSSIYTTYTTHEDTYHFFHFVTVPGKNSSQAPKDYPKESTEWVKGILMIQQTGPKRL